MKISKNHTLKSVQEAFNSAFPGLKLEFYKKGHEEHAGTKSSLQYENSELIQNISDVDFEDDTFELDPEMTVADFEALFESRYGLHVQVFRHSGSVWLQTTSTDDWTLFKQNRKGLASVEHANKQ